MSYSLENRIHNCAIHTDVSYKIARDEQGISLLDETLPLAEQLEKKEDSPNNFHFSFEGLSLGEMHFKPLRTQEGLIYFKLIKGYKFEKANDKLYMRDRYSFCMQTAPTHICKKMRCKLIDADKIDAHLAHLNSLSCDVLKQARAHNSTTMGNCANNMKIISNL